MHEKTLLRDDEPDVTTAAGEAVPDSRINGLKKSMRNEDHHG
jgi:hypothetical protein